MKQCSGFASLIHMEQTGVSSSSTASLSDAVFIDADNAKPVFCVTTTLLNENFSFSNNAVSQLFYLENAISPRSRSLSNLFSKLQCPPG